MKCVCPMGGDRTCPNDCPLAVWTNLAPADRKAQRKPIAERLYKQGFTMEAIATQLGVAQRTISRDLESLDIMSKPSRPKGGRPKGSTKSRSGPKPERRTTTPAIEATAASLVLDHGKTYEQVKDQLGLESVNTVKTSVAREEGRRDPQIDRGELSQTAQQKFDAAIRQHQAKLDASFRIKIEDEIRRRIDEIVLPHWKQKIEQAQELFNRRRGLMDKDTFNTIRRALHPDSRNSISDRKLGEAFDQFMALEKYLLNEKDSPTEFPDLPKTWQDWERAKQRATAERKARRASQTGLRPR
jgi:hypothetical protein